MLDTLVTIALTLCWILGFFVLAQGWGQSPNPIAQALCRLGFHQQFEIAKKLDKLKKDRNQQSAV
ncbi:MAG TPA: hypothetical protein ACFYEA_02550, partial [Candidatus Tripitaka californicus]|uniref:hypothetical protein n=1 Tax=Candidatus Tripitaka californicus TaxID=3367616 RepID=UPI004024D4B9